MNLVSSDCKLTTLCMDREKYASYPPKKRRLNNSTTNYNTLPPGWIGCPEFGKKIGFIIPSKVPLGEHFNNQIPRAKRYSFRDLQRILGRKLGLVIDLTNTRRYYPLSDLNQENNTIHHVKITCSGRNSVPDNESVNLFVYEVGKFLARQSNKYVVVHCTYGHNPTGYMIVHYLMRTGSSVSVTQAIKIFADSRPPGIYKPEYIDALYDFYHEVKPDNMVVCPPTPDWKIRAELDLNSIADDEDITSNIKEKEEMIVMRNDDVLGDGIPFEQECFLRQKCYQLLRLSPLRENENVQFPGSHPVSLNHENIELLKQQCYYATWKADGTRYMMLITAEGSYLIDRNFRFRRVQMRFPCRDSNGRGLAKKTHHFTLLDGEMIIDTLPGSKEQIRRYLIYDMMAISSISIVEQPFCDRWKMLEKEVIEPRNNERNHIQESQNPHYRYDLEAFRVRRKDFWLIHTVTNVLKEFIPKLPHDADGLIFQAWFDPYVPRTHKGLLKWKYAEMNSVDFLFEMVGDRQVLYLHERGRKKLMARNKVVFQDRSSPSLYSGKIIECSWNPDDRVWSCMRIRSDKTTPNDYYTYLKVMRSIEDNITEAFLVNEISRIVTLPMYACRIPIAKMPK
ncbi:hypothetical protein ACH5RR_020435 [Cinchona calisaya]|uniref:mRNA guanylyltransferase n=1 Tax=Cinchona calisaya TaxID=153742 RepID=A0ABD2ZEH1_9GENT